MAKKNAANVAGVKTKTTWKQAFKRDWQLYPATVLTRDCGWPSWITNRRRDMQAVNGWE